MVYADIDMHATRQVGPYRLMVILSGAAPGLLFANFVFA